MSHHLYLTGYSLAKKDIGNGIAMTQIGCFDMGCRHIKLPLNPLCHNTCSYAIYTFVNVLETFHIFIDDGMLRFC